MSIKHIILFLIIFSFISCKREQQTNSFCKSDNFLKSQTDDIRRLKIEEEEEKKDPDACKLKSEFDKDPSSAVGLSNEDVYISWERCKALDDRVEKRYKALPPMKLQDLVVYSGSFFNLGGDWVMINGKRIKKLDLPLCSQCPRCTPISQKK